MNRKNPIVALIAGILTLLGVTLGTGYAASPSYQATMLTVPAGMDGVGDDLDVTINQGLKGTVHGVTHIAQAPLIDGWENADTRNGTTQKWCFAESKDPAAVQDMRDALNYLSARYPSHVRWVEDCQQASYRFGDTAAADCGTNQAIACAVYLGPHSGRVSINRSYTDGRPKLRRQSIAHEMQHSTLTIGHTQCGSVPDAEPSIMSPANITTQEPCHVPPADYINDFDARQAVQKYGLEAAVPTPTPRPTATPVPQVRRVILKRWTQPEWNPGCQPEVQGWCIDTQSAVTSRGTWFQVVVVEPDGSESGPFGYQFIDP